MTFIPDISKEKFGFHIVALKLLLFSYLFLLTVSEGKTQSANIPLNKDYYHLLERYEIKQKYFQTNLFTAIKPFRRIDILPFTNRIVRDAHSVDSRADRFNLQYFYNDNWEWMQENHADSKKPLLKKLYYKKNDFFYVRQGGFDFHINPIIYFSGGRDSELSSHTFTNTRGIEVRGNIDQKLGFYLFIGENQARFPAYVQEENSKRNTVVGAGFWKTFNRDGVDFFAAQGYVNFKVGKYFLVEFGHGKHFIGDGYRSLILSDFSNNYLYLKSTLKVWRLNYTILHGSLIADNQKAANGAFPKKQIALHYLSMNLAPNFSLGVFESIIYSRHDSLNSIAIDIEYFNPIIFYRAIEQNIGDADNASLGLDFKWNVKPGIQFYGQWMIDEMIIGELLSNNGWWGNKFGLQLGVKYIDIFNIPNLDLQLEGNVVRPYTYTHFNNQELTNYQHYDQALAHPLGANFYEILTVIRYQPIPRLHTTLKFFYLDKGEDTPNENWGGDIFKPNTSRQRDYDNRIGQGVRAKTYLLDFVASYQLKHNLFIDFKHTFRKYDSQENNNDIISNFSSLSVRWNIPQNSWNF